MRFERWLMRDELRPLCRHDFLPAAEAEASKRVQAVLALFGPVPRDVFTGDPRATAQPGGGSSSRRRSCSCCRTPT